MPTFNTPVDRLPMGKPFERWKYERGRTVYKLGGEWVETIDPLWSVIAEADLVAAADRPGGERTDGTDRDRYLFLGGRAYEVSAAVAAELTTAGYQEYLT